MSSANIHIIMYIGSLSQGGTVGEDTVVNISFRFCLSHNSHVTHSSLRKSKVLDFSVGNWEKVLLLFTMPPGVLYFTLGWESTFFMAGELEEELNSLLKLQVVKSQKAKRETRAERSAGKKQGSGGHQPTRQPTNYHQHLLYSDIKHAGRCGLTEHFLSTSLCVFTTEY